MSKCSTSLVITEKQIKITIEYKDTLNTTAEIKNDNSKIGEVLEHLLVFYIATGVLICSCTILQYLLKQIIFVPFD